MLGFAALALVICGVLAGLVLRVLRQPLRSYLPPIAFGNAGNLGLPLCLFAFGKQGLGLALGFYLVGSVTQFLAGPLFQGRRPVWRTLLTTPVNYAAILGIGLLVTRTQLPLPLAQTVEILGSGHSPDDAGPGARPRHF